MSRFLRILLWCALFFNVAKPVHAQIGCVDSPENPTIVLALVGSAGAFIFRARAWSKTRRNSSQ